MSETCEVIGEERLRDLLCHIRDTFALNRTVLGIQECIADLDSLLDTLNGESVGTTLEKLSHLEGTKQAIGTAIKAKGQKVSDKDTFRSYADKVLAISGGGEGSVTTSIYGVFPGMPVTFEAYEYPRYTFPVAYLFNAPLAIPITFEEVL